MPESFPTLHGPAEQILGETIDLLQRLDLDTPGGTSREGERVTVRITPERAGERQELLLTCYAHGHRSVDWQRLRIAIAPVDQPDRLRFLPLLDTRGQARLSDLQPDRYRLIVYHRLPQWFRLLPEAREVGLYGRQVAYLQRTTDGRTVLTFETETDSRLETAGPSPVERVDRPLRVIGGGGVTIALDPIRDGLRITAEHLPDSPASAGIELCINARSPSDEQYHLVAREKFVFAEHPVRLECFGERTRERLRGSFEVLYRMLD